MSRTHEQIVDLITKAHSGADSIESRVHFLQQATELLLYHSGNNERVDEFLETFLSMHVSREVPLRRFSAYFIEMLCFTRSRYACSCLEVLVSLLQDTDRQVQIFALRAARVVYKRALYWLSVQQREAAYVQAARESVEALDHVLARIVHLITSSSSEVFSEAIRCVQSIVLSQSHSSFGSRSQAQLEWAGCSSLEDLKLVDGSALDEAKLKGQADKLFTALCALLVKKREESAAESELVALVHAVGLIGHQRAVYAGAAVVAFSQLAQDLSTQTSNRVKSVLVVELKRILSSRHCVQWQPRILPVLAALGVEDAHLVMHAETERLKLQAQTELGLQSLSKRRKLAATTDEEGERLLALSEMADSWKVPDENQAEGVCAVRAQSPAELAKLALAMLGKLPKQFEDPTAALVRVNRANTTAGGSVGLEARIKAARAMDIRVSDFVGTQADASDEDESDEDMMEHEESREIPQEEIETEEIAELIDFSQVELFARLLRSIRTDRENKLRLIKNFLRFHSRVPGKPGIVDLCKDIYKAELAGIQSDVSSEDLGEILAELAASMSFTELRTLMVELPLIPHQLLAYVDTVIESDGTELAVKRNALTTLSSLATTRPGVAHDCLSRLLAHASSMNETVRNDSLKLILAKIYRPQKSLLEWQWPYSDSAPERVVKTLAGSVAPLEVLCSETLESLARDSLIAAAESGAWTKAWPILALCSKKPRIVHSVLADLVEHVPAESSIPKDMMQAFGQSLVSIPGDAIDPELETLVKHYKSVRAAHKKRIRNEFLLPVLSAISGTDRGLTGQLADAALSLSK